MTEVVPACPSGAATPGEYVAALRQLRQGSGLTYREIARRATAAGHWLPPSTLAAALARVTLPHERVVLALLAACGTPDAEARRWLAERNEIETRLAEAARPDQTRLVASSRREGVPPDDAGPQRRAAGVVVACAVGVLAGAAGVLAVRRRGGSGCARGCQRRRCAPGG
ncbi:helix-turn-helix transcriptional regulator [Micromonospora sp. NPDC004551]|uniref:helix-turn-helix domain-containing protein n=1 Tax=Micromonospora sp. NPDC004551 TaxID=3154284 RepID=UPI0033AF6E47